MEESDVTFSVLGKPNSVWAAVKRITEAKCHDDCLLFLKACLGSRRK